MLRRPLSPILPEGEEAETYQDVSNGGSSVADSLVAGQPFSSTAGPSR
jgi:hypothetical protein